jgi:hypothetical protein
LSFVILAFIIEFGVVNVAELIFERRAGDNVAFVVLLARQRWIGGVVGDKKVQEGLAGRNLEGVIARGGGNGGTAIGEEVHGGEQPVAPTIVPPPFNQPSPALVRLVVGGGVLL